MKVKDLASRRNPGSAQADSSSPGMEANLDWGLNAKTAELRIKRNLPTALRNSKKNRELRRGSQVPCLFLVVPECHQKFT